MLVFGQKIWSLQDFFLSSWHVAKNTFDMENKLIDNCIKLGFGMMRLPRVEGTKDIDVEHTKSMVDAFIEAGGKYFDTAFVYEGSEAATKAALCDRYPRESYYLADKLNASEFA